MMNILKNYQQKLKLKQFKTLCQQNRLSQLILPFDQIYPHPSYTLNQIYSSQYAIAINTIQDENLTQVQTSIKKIKSRQIINQLGMTRRGKRVKRQSQGKDKEIKYPLPLAFAYFQAYVDVGQLDKAIFVIQNQLERQGTLNKFVINYNLSYLYRQICQLKKSLFHLQLCLKESPFLQPAIYDYSFLLSINSRSSQSLSLLKRHIFPLSSSQISQSEMLQLLFVNVGWRTKIIRMDQMGRLFGAKDVGLRVGFNLALCYKRNGDFNRAKAVFMQIVSKLQHQIDIMKKQHNQLPFSQKDQIVYFFSQVNLFQIYKADAQEQSFDPQQIQSFLHKSYHHLSILVESPNQMLTFFPYAYNLYYQSIQTKLSSLSQPKISIFTQKCSNTKILKNQNRKLTQQQLEDQMVKQFNRKFQLQRQQNQRRMKFLIIKDKQLDNQFRLMVNNQWPQITHEQYNNQHYNTNHQRYNANHQQYNANHQHHNTNHQQYNTNQQHSITQHQQLLSITNNYLHHNKSINYPSPNQTLIKKLRKELKDSRLLDQYQKQFQDKKLMYEKDFQGYDLNQALQKIMSNLFGQKQTLTQKPAQKLLLSSTLSSFRSKPYHIQKSVQTLQNFKRRTFMQKQTISNQINKQIPLKDFTKRLNTNFSKEALSVDQRKMFQSDRKVKGQYAIHKFRIKNNQNHNNMLNQTHNHCFNLNHNDQVSTKNKQINIKSKKYKQQKVQHKNQLTNIKSTKQQKNQPKRKQVIIKSTKKQQSKQKTKQVNIKQTKPQRIKQKSKIQPKIQHKIQKKKTQTKDLIKQIQLPNQPISRLPIRNFTSRSPKSIQNVIKPIDKLTEQKLVKQNQVVMAKKVRLPAQIQVQKSAKPKQVQIPLKTISRTPAIAQKSKSPLQIPKKTSTPKNLLSPSLSHFQTQKQLSLLTQNQKIGNIFQSLNPKSTKNLLINQRPPSNQLLQHVNSTSDKLIFSIKEMNDEIKVIQEQEKIKIRAENFTIKYNQAINVQNEANYLQAHEMLIALYKQFKQQNLKQQVLLALAYNYELSNQLEQAQKTYTKCLKYNNSQAFMKLGQLLIRTNRIQMGIQNLQKANCITRFCKQIQTKLVYGYSLRQDTVQKALSLANSILKRQPMSLEILIMTANILQKQGKIKQALQICLAIDNHKQSQFIKHYIGLLYLTDSNVVEAFKYFKQAISINSNHVPSLIEIATILSELKPKQAISILNKALEIQPDNRFAMTRLAKIYQTVEDNPKMAMEIYGKTLETKENYQAYMKIGDCLQKNGNYLEALLHYKQALNLKKTPQVLIKIAQMHEHKKQQRRSIQCYIQALQALPPGPSPSRILILTFLSHCQLLLQDYQSSLSTLQSLLELQQSKQIYEMLGQTYFGKGDYDIALEYYQKANQIDGQDDNVELLQAMALCFDRKEEFAASKLIYQKILNIQPTNLRAINNLANVLLIVGNTNQAFYWFQIMLQNSPDNLQRRLKVADIYSAVGDWSKVQYHLLLCYKQKQNDPKVLEKLVNMYKEKRQNKLATKFQKKLALLKAHKKPAH